MNRNWPDSRKGAMSQPKDSISCSTASGGPSKVIVDTRLLSPLQHSIEKLAHQHRLACAEFSGEDHHAVPRNPLGENLVESFYPGREERRQNWLRSRWLDWPLSTRDKACLTSLCRGPVSLAIVEFSRVGLSEFGRLSDSA